ncbi:hypothetical protein [Aliiroseovarius sediminis]|uniref:hypothetical protein n=1 Tax=Aliiroseovarius sediminis TaxID=2925839 RepID=UPI001F5AA307|nr:hypothetical protein [Aliiroseovarius sediminis]MCI2395220.1 hypothetical protein [Aliiroseovarius sediminis]
MDIVGGLTAAKLAIDLANDLREIDKSVDEAAYKMKLAELMSALAEAKMALSDAKLAISQKDDKLAQVQRRLDEALNGEYCPKCRSGRLGLERKEPHTQFGALHYGVEWHRFSCDNNECEYTEKKLSDPHGVLKELARKSR